MAVPPAAFAQDANRNWDANSTTPGSGGTGTWNTSGLNWSPNADGTSGPYSAPWDNSLLDNAIFGGTAGTVTLGTPVTVHDLTFNTDGYTLTGNTLTLSGVSPTITVNTAATGRATISSVIAGTNGLTKAGSGVLFLDGVNIFSGGITLSGGRLWVNSDAAFGAANNTITTTANAQLTVDSGSTAGRVVTIGAGTTLTIDGAGAGSARYTGSGNLTAFAGMTLSNDASDFTGAMTLNGFFGSNGSIYFTSVGNVGEVSSLGAGGTITFTRGDLTLLRYIGDGDSSNRDWVMAGSGARRILNEGTGTLNLSGDIELQQRTQFQAATAGFDLQGVISGVGSAVFTGSGAGTITLAGANTFTGATDIGGGVVSASVLADTGLASSLGAGSQVNLTDLGVLSYTGTGGVSNRTWTSNGRTAIHNNGDGTLALTGDLSFVAGGTDTLTLGGNSAETSTFSGAISGTGGLVKEGTGTWVLSGNNSYTGATTLESGTLRAGSATAFNQQNSLTVNGGTLDLDGFDYSFSRIDGTGGTIALGSGNLTVNAATGISPSFAGSITGTGGLTKLGAGTLTLSGASTYSGATTVGGGTLALDFSPTGGPASNILSVTSALNMGGGTLTVTGAAGEANSQSFNGLTITGGNNTISANSGSAGSLTLNVGAITRTGGLANFVLPTAGTITTTNGAGALGGWATVNGTDYAKVVGGNIVAFTDADYTDQDDASLWANGQFISDSDGDADSFFGTVGSSVQLGGLQFTTPDATTTVTVAGGQTLGVDGTIIVAPSVLANNQTITGGSLTGMSGGGVLGVQQNSTGTLTIASQIVDNIGAIGFTKSGTGRVVLSNSNSYTGATTVAQGTLSVNSIGNGGVTSAVGASTADASNLVIQGGTLEYTSGTAATDRGFTLARSGATAAGTISVTNAATNLTFGGQVTSSDGAGLTKIGGGTLTLTNAASDYTGVTTISGGTLAISSIGNGGTASTLGASSNASANLVLQSGGELEYTGGTASTNRGFTLGPGVGAIDIAQGTATLTMSGVAAGSGALSKNGAGTLLLSGINTYSGGTTVNNGILRAGSTQAFGTGTMTVNAGGTLDVNNQSLTIGSLAGSGTVTNLGTSALTLSGGTSTFSGVIGGSGALIRTGPGFQTFSGCNNTYTGATTINNGTMSTDCLADGGFASGIGASGNASSNLVFIGGRLTYTGASVSIDRGFTLESGSNFLNVNDAAASLEFEGVVTGAGALNKEGAGTLVLSGTNTYTGNIRVFGGVLRAGADNAFGPQGYMTLDNTAGVLLDLNDNDAVVTALIGGGANGGNIDLGSGTLTIAAVDVRSYAGAISGTGDLVMTANVNNAGRVQELTSCSSTYDGTTTVTSGVLAVSCLTDGGLASSIGDSSNLASNLVLNGGTLRYIGTGGSTDRLFTLGSSANSKIEASGTGAIAFTNTGAIAFASPDTAQTIRLGGTNTANNSFALQIADNGSGLTSFTKEDAGTWILTNTGSTYSGVTSILGGVLGVDKLADGGQASSIGRSGLDAANLVIGSGATLRYTGAGDSTNRLFTLQTGVSFIESSGTGAVAFTNTGTMGFQGTGARILALGGTNTGANIMGVSITDGTGGATTVAKNDTGNWYLTGNSTYTGPTNINAGTLFIGNGGTTGSITGGIVNVTGFGALGFNRSDTVTYAGIIQGSGGVTQAGTGTTTLTGNSTYTGGTTISAGTLQLGNGGATGSIVGNVANSGTLAFNRNNAYTFGGTITGSGTIAQIGSGTTTLTAVNTAGATTISAGTLNVNGALTTQTVAMTGTSTLNVNATTGAAAGGTAIFTGDAGAGTINVASGITLRAAGDLGGGSDVVSVAGTLNTGAGTLSLGDGNDTLVFNNPGTFSGSVAGGTGTDALQVNNASARTLNGANVTGFETLTKTLGGFLTLTGDHSYVNGVTVAAGTMQIGDGTATGTLVGDVANSGLLRFNRAGTSTYAGAISGTGFVQHNGSGTTIFTGSSNYTGATGINAGTLLINGNQSGATGLTSVASGATLGGTGTIGGNVNIANGGTLAAGSNGVGALTINGNLTLANTTQLNFEFGQAGVPGGPLNDLVNVGGNLTLDGTLNVAQSAGGTFGPGVYRMFNYAGTLTNNGVAVGSPEYLVQTSVANQVNLVNSAGLTLSFWDGDTGPHADGIISGGSGTWRAAGDVNWTDGTGAFAAPFANASFAVFQGVGGTVVVDNANGQVEATGMQFAVNGYTVQGGSLTLVDDSGQAGLQSVIRVGDGTAAGAGYTATIASNLAGATQLVKTDAGTLVLSGTNSYTGGTAINGGTLRISSNDNLGDISGGLSLNGGTFNTTASITSARAVDLAGVGTFLTDGGTTLTLSGVVSGTGALTKDGVGSLVLTNANTYGGGTTISAGTLQIGDGGTAGSILGDVVNNGSLLFARSNSVIFGGTISGSGTVVQSGAGVLTLTADNSYTGITTIRDGFNGALQLGNGGTTGSVAGDVENGGTLIFNRSNEYGFAGTISGTGDVRQEGTGTTILTAANSYTGSTIISRGTLLINGNQAAANGATHVLGGGTLGGTGTIGGDVFVGGGATLTPGDATGPGTLTINGNLGFSPNATLAYEFGQSNVVGGPLNDLTEVAGDLALDGTIDVTVSPGGSFGPGLYRVISYGGGLTNNGLDIGTMPAGSTVGVQTSIDGQVNLVNAAGGTFNFWDGAASANESNNAVDGGDGIWQSNSGNNDWTTTDGAVSGAYSDGTFAIFAAAAGTVEIDNSLGAVTASGLQFASDGYTIAGQGVTLIGPESTIRVGDGTALGLGYTATIDAALIGSTQLVKADLGTLVLSGTNTYTGGTRIDAGTLRIASDANLGDAAGGIAFSGGTLNTTADIASNRAVNLLGTGTLSTDAGTTLTLNGAMSGADGFTKAGTGALVLTGTNSFGGDVDVTAGSLFVNGDQSAAAGAMSIASGATLGGSGIVGGNVTLADGATLAAGTNNVGTLTVGGNLALSAGSLLDFEFGQANTVGGSLNDLVTVGGDLTLDGTINVSVPASGSFGPGIYRVFNYGGALTDNGLALGTLPGGSAVSVQTAVAGQVNLVNTAGLTLSFWDGDAGPKNNNAINGGNGVWRVGGGFSNWTDAGGALNADYAQSSFAIFSAAPGTVTIDNVGGGVLASGMQFASDGYTITGDALTLTGAQAIVQVGDGSVASSGYTATIASELTGPAGLVKTDAGRLILTSANSYTGGTMIDGGTLQIGNGGATGSITGDIANNAALVVNRSGALTLDGTISGTGSLTKTGSGVLTLTGTNSYSGGTLLDSGTVQISSDANLGDVAGTLSLQGGTLQAGAAFTSSRAILLGSPDSNSIDTQGFDVTLTGTIGDGPNNSSGNFVNKLGSGTLTLTGANSYSNRTVIAGGTLALAGAGTIGAGNLVVGGGTVFDISQTDTGARVIQLNSGVNGTIALGSKTLTLGLNNSFSDWSGTITDGGIGGGTGGSVVITAFGGAVRFFEANSYTGGTTVAAGTLALDFDGSLYGDGAVTVNAGAVFAISGLTGTGTTIGDLSGAGTVSLGGKTLTLGTGNDTTFSGTIAGSGGALVKAGAGTFTLAGTNSYTGGTTISGGALQLGDGGTSGSIAGDVTNNGTLVFNRSNALTFGGTISGSGAVDQFGSGTTILTGGNSYTGATSVSGGTLLINGDQSLATGATSVVGGGTLGGTGTIGGDVFVGGGATLAPGSGGVGALTINGDLGFSPNAVLVFEFGQANMPGGPLNDLVNVGGDLTLDGTINVTQSAGGSFGPGVYRIVNYAGTLTDNGLTVGSLPGGTAFVQTAVANQINLVNTAGLTLNFWDGAAGPKNDGTIQGGDGTWVLGGGANNWTEVNGLVNADYAQGSFAIFQGTGGTVTVDNVGGNVLASGMQFTADGYTIAGGPLTLTGTQAFVRVGDGSAGDAAMTATIDAALAGSAQLVKDMGGTLVLTGTNGYTGGTAVNGGTLRISSDANLGDAAGGLSFNGGTLNTTASFTSARAIDLVGTGTLLTDAGTTLTLDGVVTGAGALAKIGAGSLVLTADNNFIGGTTIGVGVLQIGNGGTTGSIVGDIANGGALVFDRSNELTISGLISGSGSIEQAGSGTTILTADSNYTGGTTISGGTLQLGNGGTTGSITGNVANDGALRFDRSNAYVFAGAISGSGSVEQAGSGTTILTGDSNYAGGTTISAGTLQLGNGGTTGSIIGDVANDGALRFDRSNDYVFAGVISGSGSVEQAGNGTTILAADSNYTGGTTISGGTLQIGNGGTSGSITGNVANDGALRFDRSNDYVFAGAISGSGSVEQAGSGTTILTGDSNYAGGTTISGGTLQLGNGGTTGSITGNVANDGALRFDRSNAHVFAGVISGSGSVEQAGIGTTILTGDSNYVGGTTISAGVLQIGNGGTSGSIAGDVANDGTLAFDRSNSMIFAGLVTGAGGVSQIGPGTTILTGANGYAGATNVTAGTLLINGDQSAATGLTSVASGATLGGTGIIGDSVNVADGGTLAAGSGGVGALTINGNLALAGTSQLAFEFGQANVPGGPLNDLVNVGGDLTLDGTINVAQSAGGSFGPGVYRVINYTGTLTDNGLTVGSLPGGTAFVQTAVANQVNLVNTAGLTLNFWDGAAGPKNDGTIQGGDGTWALGGGQNNWTEVNGAVNADYAQSSFAIFQGAGGTVTVDNAGGNVLASGLQFTVDGYTITGGPLTLAGAQAFARMGDGGAGDAGLTATIDAALTGSAQLVKDMAGTLVLTGNNSYTGGTAINGGTLRIAGDGNLGAAAGGLSFSGGTLHTTASFASSRATNLVGTGTLLTDAGTTLTLDSVVTGAGTLVKTGAGSLVLTADSNYAGGTTISTGVLQIGNGGTTGSIVGDIANNGALRFDRSNDYVFAGAISGSGSVEQAGSGTTILTGGNSYTGSTTISAGTLQLGNGGTTGSIAGDIANNGTLVFNRSDALTFAGLVTGGGAVTQAGSGTTILTRTNGYTGATNVTAGTLLINGDQSAAAGLTSVASGGTLGGTGIIGGNVSIADGILTAGSNGVGVLTINGDLALASNASLVFEFGQANVPGGPLNDLVNVGGDLTLDGTINVTQSAGGSFGPGVYRIVNYAGTLTDNGLTVGSLPGGTAFVQTAVANQINLVNTAGLTLNFWDGAAGPKNDGTIQGGDGTWVLGGGANNWTEVNGLVNADYAQGSFAIFQGTGGTVTVDNVGGNVLASGMQFTADGYTIAGGPLTLTGTQAFVRVGDGSAGDAAMTATIDAALAGSAQLVKDMGGTLVLTGTNGYTGGTAVNGGTLRISSDANLGDAAGGLSFNGGTLNTTASFTSARAIDLVGTGTFLTDAGTTFTLGGLVSGAGALAKNGAGALVLTADNSYTGVTTIAAGTLQLGDGGTTGSIVGNVVNNGTLTFNRSDALTLAGTISGSGSLAQAGPGSTILAGANSYAGETNVTAGTLLVNGNQSAATGLTSVAAGAMLGGTGTIGGNVAVADGATVAPGAGGAGTLTINGGLALSGGSTLAYEFGAANAVGNPLNDVVNVGGDLTLDGTLNVAVTPGGAFDIGLYRIANYGGVLTDNGLALGTMPAGADVFVQTSVVNQINLINVGGATLNFWDGATGPKFNNAVNGGDGVWQNGTGNDNWADATGAVNAGYDDGAFAIFTGAAGTVTIDNSLGAVTASGLQFATNGYTIGGGALALTGPQSVVRVGDGTAAGAGYTATIAAELTGNTQLVKTDLGELQLTDSNSYTGGTAVNGGTIRIASDSNLGGAAGGLSFNGGTLRTTASMSSARAIDLAGAGTFLTDAGTTLTFGGAIAGSGSLTKSGGGTLVLAGTGSYAGGTNVGAGTLLINGNYAGATGAVTVASGASLGGTGAIGGNVIVANGATLTPGAVGAGTLAIGGDLSLAAGATLAYDFGEANVAGGALNDLVTIGGDLTLDGMINVTVPAAGAFDAGIYRVFNYGGTLTDNGLTLGTMPGGSSVAVQTSIAGQVNLVNSAGLSLAFWDGAAGPKNNGVINGGTGTWQSSTGNDNWADASGAVNAGYSDGAFAIFGGTGGTVTVDNSLGAITATGMQFAANGYTISGNAVALTGPQSTIRVGDGTTAGTGFTATINSVLSGETELVKTDAGTLVLGGINSYTGGTRVTSGTVQISADANLGAAAGDVTLDGGTLATSANLTSARDIVMAGAGTISTASGTTFTFNGLLSGTGALTNRGAGTLLLTGNSSGFAGSTRVEGTMIVNGSLCGDVNVVAGGRLGGTGTVCTTVNAGTIAPGNSIGTLTVAGSYTGNNGTLEIEAELGGDASPTDRLVVTNGTSGTTRVDVINRGGLGAQTVEGIKIVDVTGGMSAGAFALNGDYDFQGSAAVIAGAYGYRLFQGGVATPTDGDWYLRSALLNAAGEPQMPLYQPGVPVYEAYGQTLFTLTDMGTLQQRVGNRQWAETEGGRPSGVWGRMQSNRSRQNAVSSTSLSDVNVDSWKIEMGADHVLSERSDGASLVLGVLGSYGDASASIDSIYGNGSIETKGYSAGTTLTWFGPQGFYADGRAQVTWFNSKLKSAVLGTLADDSNGIGQAYSLEVGKRASIGRTLAVTPQIQVVYSKVKFDRFTDPNDAVVSSDRGDSLKTRWGISIDRQDAKSHLYGVANLSYEWLDGTVTDVSGTPITRQNHRLWGELGIGGSLLIGKRLTLYTEASADAAINDFGKSYSLKGTAGLRLSF